MSGDTGAANVGESNVERRSVVRSTEEDSLQGIRDSIEGIRSRLSATPSAYTVLAAALGIGLSLLGLSYYMVQGDIKAARSALAKDIAILGERQKALMDVPRNLASISRTVNGLKVSIEPMIGKQEAFQAKFDVLAETDQYRNLVLLSAASHKLSVSSFGEDVFFIADTKLAEGKDGLSLSLFSDGSAANPNAQYLGFLKSNLLSFVDRIGPMARVERLKPDDIKFRASTVRSKFPNSEPIPGILISRNTRASDYSDGDGVVEESIQSVSFMMSKISK